LESFFALEKLLGTITPKILLNDLQSEPAADKMNVS